MPFGVYILDADHMLYEEVQFWVKSQHCSYQNDANNVWIKVSSDKSLCANMTLNRAATVWKMNIFELTSKIFTYVLPLFSDGTNYNIWLLIKSYFYSKRIVIKRPKSRGTIIVCVCLGWRSSYKNVQRNAFYGDVCGK